MDNRCLAKGRNNKNYYSVTKMKILKTFRIVFSVPVYMAYGRNFFKPVLGDSEMVVRANNILGLRVWFFFFFFSNSHNNRFYILM